MPRKEPIDAAQLWNSIEQVAKDLHATITKLTEQLKEIEKDILDLGVFEVVYEYGPKIHLGWRIPDKKPGCGTPTDFRLCGLVNDKRNALYGFYVPITECNISMRIEAGFQVGKLFYSVQYLKQPATL